MSDEESINPSDYRQGIKQSFGTYQWVWKELLDHEGRSAAKTLLLCLCIGNLVSMTVPWLLGQLVNALQRSRSQQIVTYFIAIAGALFLRRVIGYFESHRREIMYGANVGSIDLKTNRLFLQKSMGQHIREHQLLSAGGMEKGRVRSQDMMAMLFIEGGETVFLLLASYGALWLLNRTAGIVCTAMIIIYMIWSVYLNQRVATVCVPFDAEFRAWNRYREERWLRVERVKTQAKEQEEAEYLEQKWAMLIEKDRKFWLWFTDQCQIRGSISTCALVALLGWNVWNVWHHHAALGTLFPLFIWLSNIVDNLWKLGHFEHRASWNLPSIQSLRTALTMPPDITDKPDAKSLRGVQGIRLEIKDLIHTYYPSKMSTSDGKHGRPQRPVLKNVSFTVQSGETVALLGRSGAGKSTIMRLLLRGMDPEAGSISVNGTDLRDVKLHSWLQTIGYIPQSPSILDGTIKYNLLYGLTPEQRANTTDEDLRQLMKRLCIDFGDRLTHGLETRVGRGGIELSGGEQQRLMIGAAVAKRPQLFLIDEATSALDSTTERDVQDGIARALKDGTGALIIAHRLSTVRNICSKFIVLKSAVDIKDDEPQIEAVASSFEELYSISPTFRQLSRDQGITI